MQWNRKLTGLALLTVVVLLGAGCSGINTSRGVSPATFLIPGFSQQAPERSLETDAPAVLSVQTIAPAN